MDRKSGLSVEAYNHDEHWNNIVKWLDEERKVMAGHAPNRLPVQTT